MYDNGIFILNNTIMKKILSILCVLSFAIGSVTAKTIYCKMEHSWWYSDGAVIGAYAWGGTAGTNANWPGVRMTRVEGMTNTWSIDIDETKYKKIIFTRVNGSGNIADWGAQTADLDIPTDDRNFYTITSSTPTWGGNNPCRGSWSSYVIKHAVTFGVIGENGTLTAATEGSAIASGDEVAEKSEVVFTAAPAEGYELVGWYSEEHGEDAIADAGTALTYAVTISAATAVYVKFAQIPTQEVSFVNSVLWEAVSCTPTGGTAVAFTASEDVVWVNGAEGQLAACRIWKGEVPQTTTSVVFGNGSESIETTIGEGMFHAQANAWGIPFSVAYGEAVAVSNAGDGVFPNGGQVWSGATIVFTASVPEGKVVEGWYRDEACTERIDEAGTSATYTLTELTEDTAVYVKFGDGGETALEATGAMAEKSRKFVENGQLFIQRGEHVFNALGQIIR